MAARAGLPVLTHRRTQDGFFSALGNALMEANEPPELREGRESLGTLSSAGVLIAIALTISFVALALFALAEGSAGGFVVAGLLGFLSFDSYTFFSRMSLITQHPVNFVVLHEEAGGERMIDFMRAAAEPTLLLRHIVALF
jgi:hypothetical protein